MTTINTADKTIVLDAPSTKGRTLKEIVAAESAARSSALAASLEHAPSIPGDASARTKTAPRSRTKKGGTAMTVLAHPPVPATPADTPTPARELSISIDGVERSLTDTERDMVLAVLDGKITGRKSTPKSAAGASPAKVAAPKRPTTCTVTGVDEALASLGLPESGYDGKPWNGTHTYPGWSKQFEFTTRLCQVLKSAGIRTSGNYKSGQWNAVHLTKNVDGSDRMIVISIVGDVPASSLTPRE